MGSRVMICQGNSTRGVLLHNIKASRVPVCKCRPCESRVCRVGDVFNLDANSNIEWELMGKRIYKL